MGALCRVPRKTCVPFEVSGTPAGTKPQPIPLIPAMSPPGSQVGNGGGGGEDEFR